MTKGEKGVPEANRTIDPDVAEFLDDLLEFVEDGRVVPIVGEDLLRVTIDGAEIPLYRYIAARLAERLGIAAAALPPEPSLNDVVCHYLRAGGVPEEVYPKIRPIVGQARLAPPQALVQLAGIERFNLFVSLTFDSLLAAAIDQARGGDARTLELAYSPKTPQDLPCPFEELRQPVVYHLLGKLSAQPDYVITEEDTLEFLHHMQRGRGAEYLFDALRDSHLLFIGCTFPDWLARFLLRIAKSRPLSWRRGEMEALVGHAEHHHDDLIVFLRHFSPRTRVLSCHPGEFVAELARRWQGRAQNRRPPAADGPALPAEMEKGAIFLSYAREDAAAARRLRSFLEDDAGIDVWLDTSGLEGGEDWDLKIRRNIKNCSYFLALISRNTVQREEGYFRREWRWAVERSMDFADEVPFLLPVAIDETAEGSDGVPERFRQAHWTRLPGGDGDERFRRRMMELMRGYRRRGRG